MARKKRLAAGNRGHDRQGLLVCDGGVGAGEEADVFVVEEHVDEAADLARVVKQSLVEPRMRGVQRLEHLADRRSLDGDLGVAAGQGSQLGRNADLHCHQSPASSRSMASANASSVGLIVAVGRAVSATASMVFSPNPVT